MSDTRGLREIARLYGLSARPLVRPIRLSASQFIRQLLDEPGKSLQLLRALFERLRAHQMLSEQSVRTAAHSEIPVVRLLAAGPEMLAELPEEGIEVRRFPFRVGRRAESREAEALTFNDLQLTDGKPYVLALNHFALDLGPDGVVVRDRGSQLGTVVNGALIGSRANRDVAPLREGANEVIAGTSPSHLRRRTSPFRFKVVVG
jgi:hypothetical protein